MAGIALFQALDNISPGYGKEYAELFHQAGFPDPLALGTLRETDAPEVPLGVRRVVIDRLGEVNTDIFPFSWNLCGIFQRMQGQATAMGVLGLLVRKALFAWRLHPLLT